MPIKIREVKNIHILDVEGKLDINSSELIETVGWLVNTGKINMIFNFENVDMVDYNGLSILTIAYKNIINHKGRLKFTHVPVQAAELFKVVKLDSVFETYGDEETAVESFFDKEVENFHLRRRFKRLDIHLNVRYRPTDAKTGSRFFAGNVLNISAAGLYIYSHSTLPINSIVNLELILPTAKKPLEAEGKVVYLADKDIQPHAYPGMGVAFMHLTGEKEKAVIDFIDKNISHRAESL